MAKLTYMAFEVPGGRYLTLLVYNSPAFLASPMQLCSVNLRTPSYWPGLVFIVRREQKIHKRWFLSSDARFLWHLHTCARGCCLSSEPTSERGAATEGHAHYWRKPWQVCSEESPFLPRHFDVRVRIRSQQHESINFVSTVQTGEAGVMMWGVFFAHPVLK